MRVRWAIWLVLCQALVGRAASADMICRSPDGIEGFEAEFARAEAYVGQNTSSREKLHVYLSVGDKDVLYVHSNFVTPGQITDHQGLTEANKIPTKMAISDGFVSLDTITANLISFNPRSLDPVTRASAQFFIDPSVLASPRWSELDFTSRDARIIVGDEARRARPVMVNNKKRWMVLHRKNLYVWLDDVRRSGPLEKLEELKYRPDDVVILPLTTDSRTISTLKRGKVRTVDWISDHSKVDDVIATSPAPIVLVLGHFEDGAFVLKAPDGSRILRADLHTLYDAAERHGKTLIPIGCNTARHGRSGIANTFNTVRVAERMVNAASAQTFGEYFAMLSGDDADLVLDSATTKSLEFAVVSSRRRGRVIEAEDVGYIGIRFPAQVAASAAATNSGQAETSNGGTSGGVSLSNSAQSTNGCGCSSGPEGPNAGSFYASLGMLLTIVRKPRRRCDARSANK